MKKSPPVRKKEKDTIHFMDSAILREKALKLPPYDRALLADTLMASLEADLPSGRIQKWADESEDRLAAYRKGDLESIDGKSVIEKLRSDLNP